MNTVKSQIRQYICLCANWSGPLLIDNDGMSSTTIVPCCPFNITLKDVVAKHYILNEIFCFE